MKKHSQKELFDIIEELKTSFGNGIDFSKFGKDSILDDNDITEMLRCSKKTLRKRCKEGKISYLKLGARYYYIRELILLDMLKLNND